MTPHLKASRRGSSPLHATSHGSGPPRPFRSGWKFRHGYISTLSVLVLSSIMLVMVASAFRFSIQNQEVQKKTQVRIDYSQREHALMRATLDQVTNSAMRSMMGSSNSQAWQTTTRWRWIFENARNQAQGETALSTSVAQVLGINGTAISGNTGNGEQDIIYNNVVPTKTQSSLHTFYVNGGTNSATTLLGSKYPEALVLADSSVEKFDRDRPLITSKKTYSDGSLYKSLPYPKVHFGYTTQGQTFVAKRNWWAFSMDYGATSQSITGVKTKKRNYILSLYEVPSQLGLSSTALTSLGKHSDGTSWGSNVSIQGNVFANKGLAEGGLALDGLASRRGGTISGTSTVGGVGLNNFDGSMPKREEYEASNAEFFPLSSSGDSGMVAFVPINRGEDAFDALTGTTDNNSASPTGWNIYSRPAMQCVMNLRVEDVYSLSEQIPTAISFSYKVGGIARRDYFNVGANWPSANSAEGASFPFHLEETPYGRQGIAVHMGRLVTYLNSIGADPLSVNSSLLVDANYRDNANITRPNIPSLSTDICMILRDSRDFSMFTKGFSVVTPFRLYLAGDVNLVSTGVVAGKPVYPPLSLFTPEKRFGIRREAITIRFEGQVNHVGTDQAALARPLDWESGENEDVVSDNIHAALYSITDPAQLPPINQINWLIVIEEVQ